MRVGEVGVEVGALDCEGHSSQCFIFYFLFVLFRRGFICRMITWGSFADTELRLTCHCGKWDDITPPSNVLFHIHIPFVCLPHSLF